MTDPRTLRPRRSTAAWALPFALALSASAPASADDPFAVRSFEVPDRVIQADLADLDGDGRGDLLAIELSGLPPSEKRLIRVRYQRPDGTLPDTWDWSEPLPPGAAAYDLAALDPWPGIELLLLRRAGITAISFSGRQPSRRELPVPGGPTIAVVKDERGVDRLRMARTGFGDGIRLVVPGLGETFLLDAEGNPIGRLDVGARANYLVPPRPGPVIAESEIEIYFDHPRITVGDVDGDGRGDVVSSNRHEIRVFLQKPDGTLGSAPTRVIPLDLINQKDHIRSSGSVRVEPCDFDGDGRLDLLVSNSTGSFFAPGTKLTVHRNRGGSWNLAKADQTFESEGGVTTSQVIDIDGDGRLELMSARIPTGVLDIVELLLTQAIDSEVSIHRSGDVLPFEQKPWHKLKLDIAFSFETLRPEGFVPSLEHDLNGDGMLDFISSGDGDEIQIHLGDREKGYKRQHAAQELPTGGRIRFGEYDGDGLPDFVLYAPRTPGTAIQVGVNRGVLPGSPRFLDVAD